MVLDLNLEVIGLYVDNAVSVNNFYTVDYIKSVGFFLLVLSKEISIYYSWGDEIPLYSIIDEYIVLIGSKLYFNFQILIVVISIYYI